MKTNTKRIMSFLMAFAVVFTTVFGNVSFSAFAADKNVVAEWAFSSDNKVTLNESNSVDATKGKGSISVVGATMVGGATTVTANTWTVGGYYLLEVDGTTSSDMTISATVGSSKTGPKNYAFEYSLDKTEWTAIKDAMVSKSSMENGALSNVELPSAVDGKEFYLRFRVLDNVSANGGELAANGTFKLNNVSIMGVGGNANPACAKVTASPKAGTVNAATTVSLSCSTANAEIYYNTDDSDNFKKYTDAIRIVKATTIKAYAKADGCDDSAVSTFAYTVKAGTKLDTIEANDEFVLLAKTSNTLLTSTVVENSKGDKFAGIVGAVDENGVLTVEYEAAKKDLAESVLSLKATVNAEGNYTFTNAEGKFLQTSATGNSLTFSDTENEYTLWTVEKTEEGLLIGNLNASYTKNEKAYKQYLQCYNGNIVAYSYLEGETDKANFLFDAYTMPEIKEKVVDEPEDDPEETYTTATLLNRDFYDGDKIVIYYYEKGKDESTPDTSILLSNIADAKKLTGVSAVPSEGAVTIPENAVVLTVSVDGNGYYTFKSADGKYLTSGATGSALTFEDSASDYSLWFTEKVEDGKYRLGNVNAKYNNTKVQYLEYYKGFTTYSYDSSKDGIYTYSFYLAKEGTKSVLFDKDKTFTVAQWAGNANYSELKPEDGISGDLYETNDMLDTASKYYAVVGGKKVQTYTTGASNGGGSVSYYMGATGLGTGSDDYLQFELSSKGYANMSLAFRLRSTSAGVGEYQLKYSTDGKKFTDLKTGSYYVQYTKYEQGVPTNVEDSGDITDGKALASKAAGEYISFKFDVPSGAAHADKLYIRLVPGTKRADGKDTAITSGSTTRIDSVKLTGSPVVDDELCGFVQSNLESGEIPLGSELELTSTTADAKIYYSINNGDATLYDAANKPVISSLPARVTTYATKEGLTDSIKVTYSYTQAKCATIKATPNGGAVTKNAKLSFKCSTEGATIKYAFVKDGEELTWVDYESPVSLTELPATVKVKAVKEGYLDSEVSTLSFTEKSNDKFNVYFGQIHAHTNYSDGAGSCEEAFAYASKVDNLDYIAITDHSNSLDNADSSKISENVDKAETDEWTQGHKLAEKYSTDEFTCVYGYEMTWSNGLGHMNTFNTEGFQSRTQKEFSTYSTALQNYYSALRSVPDSISQFNHPGTTFGDFSDFAYYTEENDALITMIEVGNGEGAIGSSGYFPSYEYYTRALDKGWHVSPTNNQDNHKGKWGDANTARTVMLSDTNDEAAIYDAMRNYRIYATEDNNLKIYYTLDENIMGTILEQDQVGDTVDIAVDLEDGSANDVIGKVEVIVNGGRSIASKDVATNKENVKFTVPSSYSYYYIKVTEKDGDIAVTSPVWVGNVEACGINSTYTNTALAVQGEELDLNVDLYNNEKSELQINNIKLTATDAENKTTEIMSKTGEEAGVTSVASNATAKYTYNYTYPSAGKVIYEFTVNATLNGVEKTYSDKLTLNYTVPQMVTKVIVDGTHGNDYVSGYYGGNVNSFVSISADKSVKTVIETDEITAKDLEDCALLIVSAPAKKNGTANAGDYVVSHYSDDFIAMVKAYVANGGSVIVCGLADYSDSKDCQTATEQNKLLEAIGSTIRMNSDEVYDEVNNGGQPYRMYPRNFNMDSKYLAGVVEGQTYSQYSGCSVDVSNQEENEFVYAPESLVKGFDTTYSIDCKDENGESAGNTPFDNKGNVTFIAHQSTKVGGDIFVAGGVFMSDFEVKAEIDNNDSLPYANYNIINNILDSVKVELPTSTIAAARAGATGDVFAVEGYVTSGSSNEYTTFFDTIYIQDETAGIDIFPYAEAGLEIGTKVRVVGFVASYQGDKELKVIETKILDDEPYVWAPKEVSTKDAMDYNKLGGSLLKTTGVVTRVAKAENGTVEEFWLKDSTGVEAAIFIDGYIYSGTTGKNELASFVEVGATVSAVGILYMHPEGDSDESVPVFRVRDCDDIKLVAAPEDDDSDSKDPELKDNKIKTSKDVYNKTLSSKAFSLEASANGANLTFKSSNTKVVTVNSKGKVTVKGTGRAKITITAAATDKYKAATKTVEVRVAPKKASIKSVKSTKKGQIVIKWSKLSGVSSYQIQVSTSKTFKKATSLTAGSNKTSLTAKKLKAGKKYYVRIRGYKTVTIDGKKTKLYGSWSSTKTVKVKK